MAVWELHLIGLFQWFFVQVDKAGKHLKSEGKHNWTVHNDSLYLAKELQL